MTYRNDHDAALLRVDALEVDKARLETENEKLRAGAPVIIAKRTPRGAIAVAALGALAIAGIATAVALGSTPTAPDLTAPLDRCAKTLQREARHEVSEVAHVTGCRAEIELTLQAAVLTRDQRAALEHWRDAEDTLSNEVSLVTTYYESDPDHLDHYATAPQLWNEFDHALVVRNQALDAWRQAH